MKFHVEGDEVDSDLITHHPFLKMIRRHLKKAGPTGSGFATQGDHETDNAWDLNLAHWCEGAP